MKKFLLILITLSCAALVFSCSSPSDLTPDGMKIAEHGARDYFFYYSADWELDRNDGMVAIKPIPSSSGITNCSLSVTAFSLSNEKSGYTIADQWEEYKTELQGAFDEFTIIDDVESDITKLYDAPAMRVDYTLKISDTTYRYAQIICIRNSNVYLVTFTSIAADYQDNIAILDVVAKNFCFN